MQIKSLFIDGFKNISEVEIKLDTITALVAINNYGKSNVLSGIDFGVTFLKMTPSQRKSSMANVSYIPLHTALFGHNFRFRIVADATVKEKRSQIIYEYEFTWAYEEGKKPQVVKEILKYRPYKEGKKHTDLIARNEKGILYRTSESGRCSTPLTIGETELVVNKLNAFDSLYYHDLIKQLNDLKFHIENNIDTNAFYHFDPFVSTDMDGLNIDMDNLPQLIYQLKERDSHKFELLKNIFIDLFPSIEDIIVKRYHYSDNKNMLHDPFFEAANSVYALFVKDKNIRSPINFSMLSDGSKRVFLILTKILLANENNISLIAIEEPENSVHPNLFHAYLQIIHQLLKDCKVIITCHSPYVISYLQPSWIYVGVSKESGVCKFHSFKKGGEPLEKDASYFDMTMGDYLFSLLSDKDSNWEDYLEC